MITVPPLGAVYVKGEAFTVIVVSAEGGLPVWISFMKR
jgi:hypothetical protein